MRKLYDLSGNVHEVEELTYLRIKGMSAVMSLKNALELSQMGRFNYADGFFGAAMLELTGQHYTISLSTQLSEPRTLRA